MQIDVVPNNPETPKAGGGDKDKLSAKTIKVEMGNNAFKPKIFTVSASAPVSLTFISTDKKVQIITFSDSTVAALALVVPARD